MIKGSLKQCSLPVVMITLLKLKKTGRLTIHSDDGSGLSLYFVEGKLNYATALWGKDGIGKTLLAKQLISQENLQSLMMQEATVTIEQQLHEKKTISTKQLLECMHENSMRTIQAIDILMDGDFLFLPGNAGFPMPPKKVSVISTIITKTRKLEDLNKIIPFIEPLDSVPELDKEASGFQTLLKIKLNAHEGFVLSRVDGILDFNKIFSFCGGNKLETARFLLLLMFFELIKFIQCSNYVRGEVNKQFELFHSLFEDGAGQSSDLLSSDAERQEQPAQNTKNVFAAKNSSNNDEDSDDAFATANSEAHQRIIREVLQKKNEFDTMNYYEILDINREATAAEIKKAYFLMAKKYHPDNFYRTMSNADLEQVKSLFEIIQRAYETLRNTSSRYNYDSTLKSVSFSPEVTQASVDNQRKLSSEYQLKQGIMCMKKREYGRALEFFKAAQDFDPDNGMIWAKSAEAEYFNGRNFRMAAEKAKKALDFMPKDGLLHLLYAKILIRIKQIDEAEKHTKRALLYEPEHPEVRRMLQEIKQIRMKDENSGKKGFFDKLFSK